MFFNKSKCGSPGAYPKPDYIPTPNWFREGGAGLSNPTEASSIRAISLEDAHRHNNLSLLEHFKTTTVIFGVIAIAKSGIETVGEISDRLKAALKYIDADRLIAAPDCGLGFLNKELALAKLANMVTAAKAVG